MYSCYGVNTWVRCASGSVFSVTRRSRSDVGHLLSYWLMVNNDFTDVTLVSDDTERGLDWCDSGEWRWLLETWLMWLLLLRRLFRDLADVTLVSEDGFWRIDWCDSGYWGGFLETWLMWLWLLRRPFRDLTDVTLVSDDILRILDWCNSGVWGCLLETWLIWLWWVRMKVVYRSKQKLSFGEICLLMKAVQWWKLSFDESCLLMKVVQ